MRCVKEWQGVPIILAMSGKSSQIVAYADRDGVLDVCIVQPPMYLRGLGVLEVRCHNGKSREWEGSIRRIAMAPPLLARGTVLNDNERPAKESHCRGHVPKPMYRDVVN